MNSSNEALEDRVKKLEKDVAALTKQCELLEWRVQIMTVSKISHPRFPYWQRQLEIIGSMQKRQDLNVVLHGLSERLEGKVDPSEKHLEVEGVPNELLYSTDPLTAEDVFKAIKLVTGFVPNVLVVELMQAVEGQGMYRSLCEFFLSWYKESLETK